MERLMNSTATMHAARLEKSPRLQRVLEVLSDGQAHTTYEIVQQAQVCAVNSIVAELRQNGYSIDCRRRADRFYYQLMKEAGDGNH